MAKVGIVTDSTAYIPKDLVGKYPIAVVPAVVIWDGKEYYDGVDIQPDEFYARLATAKVMPTSSQPAPAAVKQVFEKMLADGYDVLGIFVSEKLSGTLASARQAREIIPNANIEIVDTHATSMGSGWISIVAARAAEKGANLAECKAIVEHARDNAGLVFMVDTLEFLHRGGRIGGAQAFIGTALNFKPILELIDGAIEPVERVRTHKKAVKRLVSFVEERIDGRTPLYIAALHANAAEEAKQLLEIVKERFNPVEAVLTDVSPAVGTHTGPGTLGLAFIAGVEM
ncbi:MAG: DegV family protein [Chloroflexota bacterium]